MISVNTVSSTFAAGNVMKTTIDRYANVKPLICEMITLDVLSYTLAVTISLSSVAVIDLMALKCHS